MAEVHRKKRPQYSPHERFQILEIQRTLGLSPKATARMFGVATSTICRWGAEATAHPEKETVGSLVKPEPPVRRCADVVRHLVQRMSDLGVGGSGLIARILTRAGWRISKRTVARIRKAPRVPEPTPERTKDGPVLTAKCPNHVLMVDLTEIPVLFRLFTLKLLLIVDVFSRMPLGARLFFKEPTAAEAGKLFAEVARRHGKADHLVSDQGKQFTAEHFRDVVRARRTRQRYGALGRQGSIATSSASSGPSRASSASLSGPSCYSSTTSAASS